MAVGDSYFFSHDIDALSDIKISALCSEFGFEAYGLFWVCLEHMFPEECLSLPYSDMTFIAIKRQTNTSCDVKAFVDRAVEYGLFERDGDMFFSPSFVSRMAKIDSEADARSEQARKAANARWQKRRENNAPDADAMQGQCSSNAPAMHEHNAPDADAMLIDANEMKRNEISLETSKDVSCTERSNDHSMPEPETFIELPLNDKTMHRVTVEDVDKYEALYPAVDIKQELRNMFGWLDSNPKRLKTRGGIKRFITNWLSKEQDKGGTRNRAPTYRSDRDNRGNFSTSFDDYEYDDGALTRVTMPRIEGSP